MKYHYMVMLIMVVSERDVEIKMVCNSVTVSNTKMHYINMKRKRTKWGKASKCDGM